MLLKEYRILLPLTTDEYRIAQLFMIAKKSRLESSGVGSGVEIIKNTPYENGPSGDCGQYTYKIYHIGNRIPLWIRNVLPSAALEAHEEAWNAYPYTKTRYSCPLISHFSVEVETKYLDDHGITENIFNLNQEELKNKTIDVINFVRDPISSHDYCADEDPKLFKSEKTGRGPLSDNWVEEHLESKKPVMCAYKLCKVEFKYWGLQTRAERWIHELALRGTMLRAHRQAWAWQDEWVGLNIEDIRQLEFETQDYLSALMSTPPSLTEHHDDFQARKRYTRGCPINDQSIDELDENEEEANEEENFSSKSDIFFDCSDKIAIKPDAEHKPTLVRWSSELLINEEDERETSPPRTPKTHNRSLLILVFHGDLFPKNSADSKITDINIFCSTMETLICSHYSQLKNRVHIQCVRCGSELGSTVQMLNSLCSSFGTFHPTIGPLIVSDSGTFNQAVQNTIRNANRTIQNFMATESSFQKDRNAWEIFVIGDFIGGLLLYEALAWTAYTTEQQVEDIGSGSKYHQQQQPYSTTPVRRSSNSVIPSGSSKKYSSHNLQQENDTSMRSLHSLSAEPTTESVSSESRNIFNFESNNQMGNPGNTKPNEFIKNRSAPPSACRQASLSSETSLHPVTKLHNTDNVLSFRPSTAFLLGCPLALVLMQRKLAEVEQHLELACDQLFNLYYALDLCAARLEPVLNPNLTLLSAMKVPRYQRYHLLTSIDRQDMLSNTFDNALETPMIWGNRRVDHELYCPPEMSSLPALALPNILHASYWESRDVSSMIIRQFLRFDEIPSSILTLKNLSDQPPLQFQMPLTVWNKRRTRFKIANLAANHRSNDLIVVDGTEQIIVARFCYGPMDLVSLSNENVLVYVLPCGGEWFLRGVETTDKHGRLAINMGKHLSIGIHHVRLIVQGDHTFLSVSIAVVSTGTPVVVFSIDGSLTASVSVTGRDPRLRPGAIDVVRFWQNLGYIIIYLTARPDMQQRLVSSWLATHNFPHGFLFFTPSLSTEPLRQKTQFMKHLVDSGISIQAAYGSAKDIAVYSNAGLGPERIFKVGGHRRRVGCVSLDNGYSTHLHDLHTGRVEIAQPVVVSSYSQQQPQTALSSTKSTHSQAGGAETNLGALEQQHAAVRNPPIQRTLSFGPRTGKYSCSKKISQASAVSSNY